MSAEPRRAVLVEDQPLTRTLLSSLLQTLEFDVTAVDTAQAGIEAVLDTDPDLLISDLDLGDGPSGLHAIQWTEEHAPWVAVVVLTVHRDPKLVDPSLPATKSKRVHLVKDDIRSETDLKAGIDAAIRGIPFTLDTDAQALPLTRDQADVLRLMSQGLSNREIARIRECTLGAVENIAQRIYSTLGLTGDEKINPRTRAIMMYLNSRVTVT